MSKLTEPRVSSVSRSVTLFIVTEVEQQKPTRQQLDALDPADDVTVHARSAYGDDRLSYRLPNEAAPKVGARLTVEITREDR